MIQRYLGRMAIVGLLSVVACSAAPAQPAPPAGSQPAPPAGSQPAPPAGSQPATSPAPAAPSKAPAVAQPTAAGAAGQPGAVAGLDPDLQKVYQEAVKVIPNLSPEILAGAKREGNLSLYRLTYPFDKVYPEFNKLFPFVRITDYVAGGGALYQRYSSEARAGRFVADVVQSAEPSQVDELDSQGLVTQFEPSSASVIPDQYVRKGVYYPFGLSSLGLAYNSDLVSETDAAVLNTWEGILDPRWKEKAGILQFGAGGAITLPTYFVWKEKGQDFWDKMFAQRPLVFGGMAIAAERLAAGGTAVHFFANDTSFSDQQKKGAPVRWRYPEPVLPFSNIQTIAKNPPNPNAARLWIEWLLSKQGQSALMQHIGTFSARTDMQDERPLTKESWFKPPRSFYKYDWTEVNKERDALQERWNRSAASLRKGN